MSYGNINELLNDAESQVKKARRKLRKVYTFLRSSSSLIIEDHALSALLKADLDLLEGLSMISESDKVCADGVKREPKWVARDKKLMDKIERIGK